MNNHNKYNLKEGERVTLDAEYANTSEVTIISFTPLKMYALVKSDEGNEWETMTNRLTPLNKK